MKQLVHIDSSTRRRYQKSKLKFNSLGVFLTSIFVVMFTSTTFGQCWKQVSSGRSSAMAIKQDGTLWGWGYNYFGQVGNGQTGSFTSVPITQAGTDNDWDKLAIGDGFSYGIKKDGSLWAWGNGTNASKPVKVGTGTNWLEVYSGDDHALFLKKDGTLWAAGANKSGQIGNGTTTAVSMLAPVQIGTDTDWKFITCGQATSFAIKNDGSLWSWGINTNGQLAVGTMSAATTPQKTGTNTWKYVSSDFYNTVAIHTDGSIWVCGQDGFGILAGTATADSPTLKKIGTATDWASVTSGMNSAIALKTNGEIWAWGYNRTGNLGSGDKNDIFTPTKIGTSNTWTQVSAGQISSHYLNSAGVLFGMGSNGNGMVGNGGTTDVVTPTDLGCPTSVIVTKSSNANLSNLLVSNVATTITLPASLQPRFAETINSYGDYVDSHFKGVLITPTVADAKSTVKVNGTALASGTQSAEIPLNVGDNSVKVEVTAEDGTVKIYTINVARDADITSATVQSTGATVTTNDNTSSCGNISVLTDGIIDSDNRWCYNGSVNNTFAVLDLGSSKVVNHWRVEYPAYAEQNLDYNLSYSTDNVNFTQIDKVENVNTDGITRKLATPVTARYFKVTVTRKKLTGFTSVVISEIALYNDAKSSNANLSNLTFVHVAPTGTFNNVSLQPNFSSTIYSYGDYVRSHFKGVLITPTVADAKSTVKVNGTALASGTQSAEIPLNVGDNSVKVEVTAEDGTVKTYTINVARDADITSATVQSTGATVTTNDNTSTCEAISVLTDGTINSTNRWCYAGSVNNTFAILDLGAAKVVNHWRVEYPAYAERNLDYNLSSSTDNVNFTQIDKVENVNSDGIIRKLATPITARYFKVTVTQKEKDFFPVVISEIALYNDAIPLVQCWKQVSSGATSTMAIKGDGTLWGWGYNYQGQLGNDQTGSFTVVPISQSSNDNDWDKISLGHVNAYAIKKDGSLWAWGDKTNSSKPVKVGTSTNWLEVFTGDNHALFLKKDGTLWAAGDNKSGQIGNGTNTAVSMLAPIQIGLDTDWKFITCGSDASFAIKNDGSLWSWGRNTNGQLANGSLTEPNTPQKVGTSTWKAVSSYVNNTVAIHTDGSIWVCGENGFGILAGTSSVDSPTLKKIGTSNDWASVASQSSAAIALKTNGEIWAWGYNRYGNLGSGNKNDIYTPTKIGTSNNWTQISGGQLSAHYLNSSGELFGMGSNGSGQVGNGGTTDVVTPTDLGCPTTVIVPNSSNTNLSDLLVSNVATTITLPSSIQPRFKESLTSYGNYVSSHFKGVLITPTAAYAKSTIKINGTAVASGTQSAEIPINVGDNSIKIEVTSEDGKVKIYTINVARDADITTATLQSTSATVTTNDNTSTCNAISILTDGIINSSNRWCYSGSVNNSYAVLDLGAAKVVNHWRVEYPAYAEQNLDYNLSYSADNVNFTQIDKVENVNSDGIIRKLATPVTARYFKVTVTRKKTDLTSVVISEIALYNDAKSSNTKLSNLQIIHVAPGGNSGNASLSPLFSESVFTYGDYVNNQYKGVKITPTVSDAKSTVKINGTPIASGTQSVEMPLNVGDNTFTIEVTAEDGTIKSTIVNVARDDVNGLTVVSNNATVLTQDNVGECNNASVLTDGIIGTDNKWCYRGSLNNTFVTIDMLTAKPVSTWSVQYPAYAGRNVSYNLSYSTDNVNFTQIDKVENVNNDGVIRKLANLITARYFKITVTQKEKDNFPVIFSEITLSNNIKSSNAFLSALVLKTQTPVEDFVMLAPLFVKEIETYNCSVQATVKTVTITPTVDFSKSTVTVNGVTVASGQKSLELNLANGNNTFTIKVTAEDGSIKTYVITCLKLCDVVSNVNVTGNSTTCEGGKQTFSASATNATDYKWYFNGTAIDATSAGLLNVTGYNTSTLTIASVAGMHTGKYKCAVSNVCGSVESNEIAFKSNTIPTATLSGTSTICSGATANLSLALTGTSPWTLMVNDGVSTMPVPVTLANSIVPVTPSTTQTYTLISVMDANACIGGTISGTAMITVLPNGWNGSTSTDWHTASNWCGGVPTALTDVVIPNVTNQPVISALAICKNIKIENGSSLTIAGTNKLDVKGDWMNNGTFLNNASTVIFSSTGLQTIGGSSNGIFSKLEITNTSTEGVKLLSDQKLQDVLTLGANAKFVTNNNIFTFISTDLRSARLAVMPAGASIVGNVSVEKFIPAANGRYWYHIGSPVIDNPISNWQKGFHITGLFSTASVAPGLITTGPTMFAWNASVGDYFQKPETSNTESLAIGQGVKVLIRDGAFTLINTTAKNYTSVGKVHVGELNFPLSYSNKGSITTTPVGGWSLISNPYISDISVDMNSSAWNISDMNKLDGTSIYIYNHVTKQYESCNSGLGTCTVSAGQGFWVRTKDVTNITIKEVAKQTTSSLLKRVTSADNSAATIMFTNGNGSTDKMYVRNMLNTTADFDGMYDAYKLEDSNIDPEGGASPRVASISSYSGNNTYSIDSRDLDKFGTIDLRTVTSIGMNKLDFSTIASSISSFYSVSLSDKVLNTVTDVKANPVYSFAGTTIANDSLRFTLVFKREVTGLNSSTFDSKTNVRPNPTTVENGLYLKAVLDNTYDVSIYDMLGNQVHTSKVNLTSTWSKMEIKNLKSGVYTLIARSSTGNFTSKVIVE